MSPYKLGQDHAREMLTNMSQAGVIPKYPLYLVQRDVWPEAGPFTWDQYVRGAQDVLGQSNVRYPMPGAATPKEFS